MKKIKINKTIFPSMFTILGLFFGFSAILFCLQAASNITFKKPNLDYIPLAGYFIALAALFDMFDGRIARLIGAESELGKEMDSLADLVVYGISTGVLFFTITMLMSNNIIYSNVYIPEFIQKRNYFIFKIFAFIFPIAVIYRLARFNIGNSKIFFYGIPSTYAGGIMAIILTFGTQHTVFEYIIKKLISFYHSDFLKNILDIYISLDKTINVFLNNYMIVFFMYVFLSFLMVSKLKFYKINRFIINDKTKKYKIKILFIYILAILLFTKYALIIISGLYFFHGLIFNLKNIFNKNKLNDMTIY